jgi:hypothetical protein
MAPSNRALRLFWLRAVGLVLNLQVSFAKALDAGWLCMATLAHADAYRPSEHPSRFSTAASAGIRSSC